ncbi:nucleotide-binding protein [Pseudomonas coleopterorum]|uniref:nucleotide-binding protein n=1 Tax=Pseudomonas coleopterorum TaxID=1605838 RepID=UPI002A69EC01|nr:nucleotide-binding protein [Pseudomonas coleopterorum]MDY1046985.1 nucleotide-binding protein [Pseudomonas coleopterorum]
MSLEFLTNNYERISYLLNLLTTRATGKPASDAEYQQLRNTLLRDSAVAAFLPPWLKLHNSLDSFWNFIQPKFKSYADRRDFLSAEFTPLLDALELPGAMALPAATATSKPGNASIFPGGVSHSGGNLMHSPAVPVPRNKRNVFIVHGRDNEAKQEVSRFIESLGLKAIVLHEQASGGKTIIEKIEHYANDADFALALYTPCDLGRGVSEGNTPPKNRARQNVVFEHGYLMGKLGRENVCALKKGDIETPNDISGVVYVDLDPAGVWKTEVVRELRGCGYTINQW